MNTFNPHCRDKGDYNIGYLPRSFHFAMVLLVASVFLRDKAVNIEWVKNRKEVANAKNFEHTSRDYIRGGTGGL
ncbi:hypothetical protein L873DRAFT_1820756 [Choiromyces venosus 120613-1]|uniref:Uncharacterized protein n=1 Tax=Choiromyces venosus 120613-1 TaxID=1336337 RepID=A0A3N4IXG7_9PEZI|nr:hypothetical protein L873DRAFT_1820756 [Choiromyces venosus 120613-1]